MQRLPVREPAPGRPFSTAVHIVLAALLLALTTACGERAEQEERFRVALLTPGPISDQSWNAGAYEGLLRIRDSLGAEISHVQTRTPADFEENFREYGAQGYDLVIGHGFEFQDAAMRVGPDFPGTVYVTTSGRRTGKNVAGIIFGFEDASYLAGVVAGATTKTDTIGAIGGTELPPVRASFAAFEAGARSINPDVTVLTSYIGNWDDPAAGKEAALAQIGRGADILFQNADAAGLGIFQAARETGTYVIGSNVDQNAIAPEVTLGSVVIDIPRAMLLVAREVREGTFEPRVINLGQESDVVRWVPNPRLASRIPPAARAAVDSVAERLRAGTFEPPTEPFAEEETP